MLVQYLAKCSYYIIHMRKSLRKIFLHFPSPVHHLVDDGLLFRAGPAQVNPGGFDALMSHQVSQERDIGKFFEKIFGETVPERMGIHHLLGDVIAGSKFFS